MDLVILAAGMGSRYGGLKQIDPVGPSGETVLDYAVYDARREGFERVVFVIRKDFQDVFRAQVGAKYAGQMRVEYVFQAMDDLPGGEGRAAAALAAGRPKPWGTGHAVWCARGAVKSAFAVINADDFYGRDSFRRLGAFLHRQDRAVRVPAQYAMVGFRLEQTLSEHGAVSRGVAAVKDGKLETVVERTGILAAEVGAGKAYGGEEIVSMNCWGFTPLVFDQLEERLARFLEARGNDAKAEFYLPAAVADLIKDGRAEVEVLPTNARWFGVTYKEDRPAVMREVEKLVRDGTYPAKLF